ncbi:unnamed protein product [Merluccius merluccius]
MQHYIPGPKYQPSSSYSSSSSTPMWFYVPWSHGAQSRARSDRRQRSQQPILRSLPVHLIAYSGAYLSGGRTARLEEPHRGSGRQEELFLDLQTPRTLTQLSAACGPRRSSHKCHMGDPAPIPLAGPNQRPRGGPRPGVPGPPLAPPQGMPSPPPDANSRSAAREQTPSSPAPGDIQRRRRPPASQTQMTAGQTADRPRVQPASQRLHANDNQPQASPTAMTTGGHRQPTSHPAYSDRQTKKNSQPANQQ